MEKTIYKNKNLRLEIYESSEPILFAEAEYQGRKVKLNKIMQKSLKYM